MDTEIITWIFLGAGILLMLVESFLPGGIAFILGLSSVLVATLRYVGLLEDPMAATITWVFLSIGLTLAIRPLLSKFFSGKTSFKYANEDFEAMDQIVEVIEPINELDDKGRIRFQGITWQARSVEGKIPAGSKVRIKYRENVTWIVEPYDAIDPGETDRIKLNT